MNQKHNFFFDLRGSSIEGAKGLWRDGVVGRKEEDGVRTRRRILG
jgi:hypothetical protein